MTWYSQAGDASEYVHRIVAERALGRPLPASVEVHHVDGDITSRTPRLVICQDRAYHKLLHARERIVRAGGNPNTQRVCSRCREVLPISAFGRSNQRQLGTQNACKQCGYAYKRARKPKGEAVAA